jgi:DNA polymerase I-like protein with 3'-5' exonuclease and polymerase domains
LKSTYVDGWKPGRDGRVHPEFTNKPATGQLSSHSPNAQQVFNPDKSPKMAALFRPIIRATPGHTLIEFDWKSFHVLTTGFEARDLDWMRLARLDMHSYVAGVLLGAWKPGVKSESDDSLRERFKWLKSDPERKLMRNGKAKPAILGVGFGMQAHRLWKENEETIQNKAEAQKLLDLLHDLFPRVFKWQDEIRELAHRQSYLISRHGWMRWFWDVKRWSSEKGDWIHGDDSEKAIAFLPANDAHCMLKAALIRLEHRDLLKGYGFINTVHDSLLFECPTGLVDECVATVREEMERPSPMLVDPLVAPDGLSVGVDVKLGRNWQEMLDYKSSAANVLIPRAPTSHAPQLPPP